MLHARVSLRQAPPSAWKPALHAVIAQAPQAVPPAAQVWEPVPFEIAQAREPDGLLHDCAAVEAPQRPTSVGVQPWEVMSVPHEAVEGVQLWEAGGAPPVQSALPTVSPKLFTQVTLRVWVPELASTRHEPARVCAPLEGVRLHIALRV